MFLLPIFVHDRLYIPHNKATTQFIDRIKALFVYPNPDYFKKKRMGYWVDDNEKYIFNYKFDVYKDTNCLALPRGGLDKIRDYISKEHDVEIQTIDERLTLDPIDGMNNNVILRPDQEKLLNAILAKENCLIRSPTGSGKGELGLKIAELLMKKYGRVLVIVWQSDLYDEWISRAAKRFEVPESYIGTIKGSKKKIAPLTIAMQQTLKNCIDDYRYEFSTIICDEIQRFAANTYQYTIDKFPAKYRIGISADETRKDAKEVFIYDMFGKVAEEIKQSKLVDKGAIHEVILRVVPTDYNYYVGGIGYADIQDPKDKNYPIMLNDMCQDKDRNDLIWEFMEPVLESGASSVVMSHRVKHVIHFDEIISKHGYKCGKILGGDYKDESAQTIRLLKDNKLQVGVGTIPIKLGQAVDVPSWKRGFLLTPVVNNKQQLKQITGRLTRRSKGKKEAIMYVFWDRLIYPYALHQMRKLYRQVYLYNFDNEKFEWVK